MPLNRNITVVLGTWKEYLICKITKHSFVLIIQLAFIYDFCTFNGLPICSYESLYKKEINWKASVDDKDQKKIIQAYIIPT